MAKFRKLIFWMHLIAGVVAGVIVLVMSVTGVAIAYEKQLTAWADGYQVTPPPGAVRLGVEALLAKAHAGQSNAVPSGITMRADAGAPVAVSFGREKTVFVNPYTGDVLGEGSTAARAFFHLMTDWHRWLGASEEHRARGRAITGACNLAFLFLVVSGFYLWWPRQWTAKVLAAISFPSLKLSGKARDWNWHNAIGFWSAPVLFFIVVTGVIMSYPWANNLLYTLTGSEAPPARAGFGSPGGGGSGGPGGAGPGAGSRESKRSEGGGRGEGEGGNRKRGEGKSEGGGRREGGMGQGMATMNVAGLDKLWARAEQQSPGWQSIAVRGLPQPGSPVTFSVDTSAGSARPDKRAQLTLDATSGEVVKAETYDGYNMGRKLRLWSRYVHTGEAGGFLGQTLAFLVSAGAAVLVWTGFALTWRRFRARNDKAATVAEGFAEVKAAEVAARAEPLAK